MTERELTAEVIKICTELGLLWHHCPNSSRCQGPKGLPDLVIVGYRGVVYAELKSDDGETTAEQDRWLYKIAMGGSLLSRAFVWRPADLEAGRIRKVLEAIK